MVERWKPTRAGVRNVWEYDDQVFDFADGRLILRGPNGSGKSNALALLFPFLFEGTMSATAMDPFAGGRSMRSLLLGVVRDDDAAQGFRHDRRLGYVWLELGNGHDHVTIGCGARATADAPNPRSWFFVTPGRVNIDFTLDDRGELHERKRLIEVLGRDEVFDTAEQYRGAVDRAILGMGDDRHRKLISLIRVLRRPQLAGKLNLDLLSEVLSSGLPGLGEDVLDDIASSLDDLETTQRELADVQAARSTVETFLPVYTAYLRGEAARRVAAVQAAEDTRRAALTQAEAARAALERIDADLDVNAGHRQEVDTDAAAADAEKIAVIESPAFKDASSLRELDASAERAGAHRDDARRRVDEAAGDHSQAVDEAERAVRTSHDAARRAAESLTGLVDAADAGDIAWTLSAADSTDPELLASAARTTELARRDDLRAVHAARRRHDAAASDHQARKVESADAGDAAEAGRRRADALEATAGDHRAALATAVATWASSAPGLDEPEPLVAHVGELGEPGAATLADRYRALTAPARDQLVADRTAAESLVRSGEETLRSLRGERERVAAETDAGPEPAPWRTARRDRRPGAPLWACCDFADHVDGHNRAALEAALDAAGLLDAWLSPEGAGRDGHDSWLMAPPAGTDHDVDATLRSVLVATPPPGSGLAAHAIEAVLGAVALGAVGIAVDPSGRFTLGPLHGRAGKAQADYVGATARAARRARRLAVLDDEITTAQRELERARAEVARLIDELRRLDEAPAGLPPTAALLEALAAFHQAHADARARDEHAERARSREADAAAQLAGAERALRETATARRLPTSDGGLTRIDQAVDAFARAATNAIDQLRTATAAAATAADHEERARQLADRLEQRRHELAEAEQQAVQLRTRADTLRSQLGPDAEAPIDALRRCERRLAELKQRRQALEDERNRLTGQQGEAGADLKTAAERVSDAVERVAEAGDRLGVLRRGDIRVVIAPGQDDLPPEPLAASAALAAVLPTAPTDDDHRRNVSALDRAQKALLDDLYQGYDPAIAHHDGVTTIEITADRGTFGIDELARTLRAQEQELQTYLTEGDREVFERFLLNRVAHELRTLLSDADDFVAHVNKALGEAPTASGLRVELVWEFAENDRSMSEAVTLLRHDTNQLGEPERARLRSFFERIIREQRAERPADGYKVALGTALDYRSWHRFQPYLRSADGGRTRLTQKRFRELSGGEQAVTLHLPLFAAAAAHYDRAGPDAPRLVALDEAFAGIDEAMRGELMGLTVRFDLDLIMTGHELWGAYSEVPAVAVHDLLRRPPAEGVNVLSMRWDGTTLLEDAVAPDATPAGGFDFHSDDG